MSLNVDSQRLVHSHKEAHPEPPESASFQAAQFLFAK